MRRPVGRLELGLAHTVLHVSQPRWLPMAMLLSEKRVQQPAIPLAASGDTTSSPAFHGTYGRSIRMGRQQLGKVLVLVFLRSVFVSVPAARRRLYPVGLACDDLSNQTGNLRRPCHGKNLRSQGMHHRRMTGTDIRCVKQTRSFASTSCDFHCLIELTNTIRFTSVS